MITRKELLALAGAAVLLPQCSGGSGGGNPVRVGSKNFGEDIIVAQVYAAALERAGIPVQRHMNLGSTQIATSAMQRGDIDVYPEYTGTGLIDVLRLPPMRDARTLYETVKAAYAKRYGFTWLTPSPANDSQGLAVTRAVAQRYGMTTLSQCAKTAPHLRLAAIPEFVSRADALPGLQKYYGGFQFANVRTYEIGLQYDALQRGDADVATAFTTDSQIATDSLVLLADDRHFWPAYNIAPLVRNAALGAHPQIAAVLNRIAPAITDAVLRRFNYAYNVQHAEPEDIAQTFVKEHGA